MSIPVDLEHISFHDSGLTAISREGQTVFLSLENVYIDGDLLSVNVTIKGVEKLCRNDTPLNELSMETDNGEVIQLGKEEKCISLLLEWHKYSPSSHEAIVYDFYGADVDMQAKLAQVDVDGGRMHGHPAGRQVP